MPRDRRVFACRACGAIQTKWAGRCAECHAWDSLEPQTIHAPAKVDPRGTALSAWSRTPDAAAPARPRAAPDAHAHDADADAPSGFHLTPIDDPAGGRTARALRDVDSAASLRRIATGLGELDRVLGGGLVPGSAVLLGGDPGIGKSTLLLQAAAALARAGTPTLYVSSEESAQQVKQRALRLTSDDDAGHPVRNALPPRLFVLAETSLARIVDEAARVLAPAPEADPEADPDADRADPEASPATPRTLAPPNAPVLIIDSVQMVYQPALDAFPGSITQLRRCCAELVHLAKASGVAVVLVGHVTKDGQLAGPRLLEHLVDAVLSFEGDRYHAHRLVRAVKNRFGSTLELGLMEMTGRGLVPAHPGAAVAALAELGPRPGSVLCPVLTGSRCLLVELQALTATGFLGAAKRKSSGIDAGRLAMLIAVLEQHAQMRLADRDVFASAVGGVRVAEPAADLALLLAVAGAQLRRALPVGTCALGEVGLGGEVRSVTQLEPRLLEAQRLGCTRVILAAPPASPAAHHASPPTPGRALPRGLAPTFIKTVAQAIDLLEPLPRA